MWTSGSEDRLKEWKKFREHIGTLPFDKAVADTVHLWSYAPFVNHHLDKYEPFEWPTPWELLVENKYDDTAKALGMLYTLFLSAHGRNHAFDMLTAKGASNLEVYNLVSIDKGKYILNFIFDEIISTEQLDKEVQVVKQYSEADLQLSKY